MTFSTGNQNASAVTFNLQPVPVPSVPLHTLLDIALPSETPLLAHRSVIGRVVPDPHEMKRRLHPSWFLLVLQGPNSFFLLLT
jgi:hypothetical protein